MKEVTKYFEQLLNKNDTVVVATSAGPDSMLLLNLVLNLKKEKNLNIICCHVNHNVRKESNEEEAFLKEYCQKKKIYFESMTIKNYSDDNFHNEARRIRYDFFKKIVKKYNAKYLMTAHHGDDLIESILMRIVRGSNLKGYIGFKKESSTKDYQLIRPLITLTKSEIEEYDNNHNIKYFIDESNNKDKYTRNRYRHHVLPFLKSEDKNVHNKFLKFSEQLIEIDNYLDRYMCNIMDLVVNNGILNIGEFLKQDEFIKKRIIESMIDKIQEDDLFFIETKHIDQIMKLIKSKKANVEILLPNNYKAIKSYETFKIVKNEEIQEYNLEIIDQVLIPNNSTIIKDMNCNDNSNYVIRLNSKEIKLPIFVRNRKNGDKMEVKNLNGYKKIKDIFIDCKISKEKRDNWPIVVDSNNNILWIPGLKKSKFAKESNDNCDIILKYEEE